MGLFEKGKDITEEITYRTESDDEVGAIFLLFEIQGEDKVIHLKDCLTLPKKMYKNGDYEEMVQVIMKAPVKKVKISYRLKKNRISKFTLDTVSLSDSLHDERFRYLETAYTLIE